MSPRRSGPLRAEYLFEREDAIESLAQVLEDFKMGLDEACDVFSGIVFMGGVLIAARFPTGKTSFFGVSRWKPLR